MRYYKRHWDESRGDKYDHWGSATYFFEADDDGSVVRQVEIYQGGRILRYCEEHPKDDYGMLTDQPLDIGDFQAFEISQDQFDLAWPAGSDAGPVGT